MNIQKDESTVLKQTIIASPDDPLSTFNFLNNTQLGPIEGLRIANWNLCLNPLEAKSWKIWLQKNTSIPIELHPVLESFINFSIDGKYESILKLSDSLNAYSFSWNKRLSFLLQKQLPKSFKNHKDIRKLIFYTAVRILKNPKNPKFITGGIRLLEAEGKSSINSTYWAISIFESLPISERVDAYKALASSIFSAEKIKKNKKITIIIGKLGQLCNNSFPKIFSQNVNKPIINIDLVSNDREIVSFPIFLEAIHDHVLLYTQSPCTKLLSSMIIGFRMNVLLVEEPRIFDGQKDLSNFGSDFNCQKSEQIFNTRDLLVWGLLKDCPSAISWRSGWQAFLETFADYISDETQKISRSGNRWEELCNSWSRSLTAENTAVLRIATYDHEPQPEKLSQSDDLVTAEIMDLRAALKQYTHQNYIISKIKTPLRITLSDTLKISSHWPENPLSPKNEAKFTKLMSSMRMGRPISKSHIDAVRQFLPKTASAPKLLFVGPPKSRVLHYARTASAVTSWPLLNVTRGGVVGSSGYNEALPEEVLHFSSAPTVMWSHEIPSNFLLATIAVQKIPFFVDCGVVWDELIREWLIWCNAPITLGHSKCPKAAGLKGLDPWVIFLKGFANYIQFYVAWTRAAREFTQYGEIGRFNGSASNGVDEINRMLMIVGLKIPYNKIGAVMKDLEMAPVHPRHIHHDKFGPPIADGVGYTFFSNNILALAARTYNLFPDVDFRQIDPKNPYH